MPDPSSTSDTVVTKTPVPSRDIGVRSGHSSPSCDLVITAGATGHGLDTKTVTFTTGDGEESLYDVVA